MNALDFNPIYRGPTGLQQAIGGLSAFERMRGNRITQEQNAIKMKMLQDEVLRKAAEEDAILKEKERASLVDRSIGTTLGNQGRLSSPGMSNQDMFRAELKGRQPDMTGTEQVAANKMLGAMQPEKTKYSMKQDATGAWKYVPETPDGGGVRDVGLTGMLKAEKGQTITDVDDFVKRGAAEIFRTTGTKATPGQKNNLALQYKRAQPAERAAGKTAEVTADLTTRLELEPAVKFAVTAAESAAKAEADRIGEDRSNERTWNVYDVGMRNLADALSGTKTMPGMDWTPALTANAQIANGAVAAMAPVLKQMFRAAGEGIFTDKDQEMLLNMIPTRSDHPAARDSKISSINDIVKAKLGMNGGSNQGGGQNVFSREQIQAEREIRKNK